VKTFVVYLTAEHGIEITGSAWTKDADGGLTITDGGAICAEFAPGWRAVADLQYAQTTAVAPPVEVDAK